MYTDAHNIDSKGENTENSTLTLTKSTTSQKIASQLHIQLISEPTTHASYAQVIVNRSSVQ